jgi:predicted ArsR family transcriptional regulator
MARFEAVADPVRLAIARWLAARPGASASEVAAGVGVHLNTARAHLARLHRLGVVERLSDSRGRRGRPLIRYRIAAGWAPRGDDFLALAGVLADSIVEADAGPHGIRDAAFRWGRRHSTPGSEGISERLEGAMARLGFSASVAEGRLALSSCPCPLVCSTRPQMICGLADAVVDGVLEGSGTAAVHHEHDPVARSCSTFLGSAVQCRRRASSTAS